RTVVVGEWSRRTSAEDKCVPKRAGQATDRRRTAGGQPADGSYDGRQVVRADRWRTVGHDGRRTGDGQSERRPGRRPSGSDHSGIGPVRYWVGPVPGRSGTGSDRYWVGLLSREKIGPEEGPPVRVQKLSPR